MVISGYQSVIIGYLVINKLSMVINGYQGFLMVISQLSMVIKGYWLSTSYQGLLMVISVIGYQWLSMVING